jgi:hypothetical protein
MPRRHNFPSWHWAGWQVVAAMPIGSPFDFGFQGKQLASNDAVGRPESIANASSIRAEGGMVSN